MPRRPPKEWWSAAIQEIKKNPEVTNPRKVAGWVWYHWMNPAAKKAALKREGKAPLLGIDIKKIMKKKNKKQAKKTLNALRRAGKQIAREAGYKPGERYFFGKKSPQHKGGSMAKHKKGKAHMSGMDGSSKKHGGKHNRTVAVRHILMGAHEGGGFKGIGKILLNALIAGTGAVGGSFVATKVPIPVKFKPAIPLGIAIILALMGKKVPMANILALGNAAASGLGFAKQILPNLPLLAGVDSIPALEEHEKRALLGESVFSGGDAVMAGGPAPRRRRPGER